MSDEQQLPGPGWYPDPHVSGGMRWWDGTQWTSAAQPPTYAPQRPRIAPEDVDRWSMIARWAVPVGAAGYVASTVTTMIQFADFRDTLDQILNDPASASTQDPAFGGSAVVVLVGNLAQTSILVVGALFLVWFYKAAAFGRQLGLDARRSPGWAVGGFIIPIINYWFPYQSAVDMVPKDSPARTDIGWWWALYIAMTLAWIPLVATAIYWHAGRPLVGAASVALVVAAAFAAVTAVRSINEEQQEIARPAAGW